jgi:hypothetical protein
MNEFQWPRELEELQRVLVRAGFLVVLAEVPLLPGNAVVELSSPGLGVRLQREGGDWQVSLRYPKSQWRPLRWWQREVLHNNGSELRTPAQQGAYVEEHLAELMGYEVEFDEVALSDAAKQRASYLADGAGVARPAWTSEIVARGPKSVASESRQTEKIPLPSDLERLFPVLLQAGFRVVREEKFESFGNAIIELAGPKWTIRFGRDRDCWHVEVKRPRSDWRDIQWWQRNVAHDNGPDLRGIHAEAAFVEEHLAELRGDGSMRETADDPAAIARRNAASLGAPPPSWATEPGGRPPSTPWRVRWWKLLFRLRRGRRD